MSVVLSLQAKGDHSWVIFKPIQKRRYLFVKILSLLNSYGIKSIINRNQYIVRVIFVEMLIWEYFRVSSLVWWPCGFDVLVKTKNEKVFQQGIELLPQLHYKGLMDVQLKFCFWKGIFLQKRSKYFVQIYNSQYCFKLGAHNENVTCIKFFHLWSISNPCWWFVLIYMLMIINVARWGVGNYSAERKERRKNYVLLFVAWEVFSNEMDGESSFDITQALIKS